MAARELSIVNWNVEWRQPQGRAARILRQRIFASDPDVICLTESYRDFLPSGHMIEAEADYGYAIREGRRKVLLWSKRPWMGVDAIGHPKLPGGRFIRGQTETLIGSLDVVGVCIPWASAHVTSGRRDRRRWEDHIAYLEALADIMPTQPSRLVVMGDFNQTVPRTAAPLSVYQMLDKVLLSQLSVVSSGWVEPLGCPLIDHICTSRDLSAVSVLSLSNVDSGRQITDHVGVHATIVSI